MYKKIVVLLVAAIVAFTSCQAPSEVSKNEMPKPVQQSDIPAYEVDNDGGLFSQKDLIYFIMTDRFYDGEENSNQFKDFNKSDPKAYHGGDLKGIIEKLDYIESLGTTAIWITPVAENTEGGYHGYWINDFYKVDPHLGSMEDLKTLVAEAHQRDIKVLLDFVVNHTSPSSALFKEKGGEWFNPKKNISNWNNQEEVEKGWIYGLPDLNQDNPEVTSYFIENALWWIQETAIDGMRLDTVKHVPKSFWNEFAYLIKAKHPDFYLLGEVWNSNPRYLEQYHALGIDGMTDYPLFEGIRAAFTRFGKTDTLVNAIKQRDSYTNPEINCTFIDNHDNKRLVTHAGENGPFALKQALTFIMTYPSIPVIYYGTELGMEGGDDPDNRRDMDWKAAESSEVLEFYKMLVELRSSNTAVSEGSIKLLNYDSYFLSYLRQKEEQELIIVMNLQGKEKLVTVNLPNKVAAYQDRITGSLYSAKDNSLELTLKPFDILLLESK